MARVVAAVLALAASCAGATLPSGRKVETRIVGGTPVPVGSTEFLWLASLQDGGSHFCGGTLVAPSWVVTAAHCVESSAPSQVVLGITNLGSSNAGVKRTVKRVIKHEQYNSRTNKFDFALLELSSPVTTIEPLALVDNAAQEAPGSSPGVAGWGTTSSGGSSVSQVLREVTVPIQSYATCTASGAYEKSEVFDDLNICAGLTQGGKDSCQGDSGGPLYSQAGGVKRLIGVVSWGYGCAAPKKYGIYTRVSALKSWVLAKIGGIAPTTPPVTTPAPSPVVAPTPAPSPSAGPTSRPRPTVRPTRLPTPKPTMKPTTRKPTRQPTPEPTESYSSSTYESKTYESSYVDACLQYTTKSLCKKHKADGCTWQSGECRTA
jgi:secreted trypsin-like serine protease